MRTLQRLGENGEPKMEDILALRIRRRWGLVQAMGRHVECEKRELRKGER